MTTSNIINNIDIHSFLERTYTTNNNEKISFNGFVINPEIEFDNIMSTIKRLQVLTAKINSQEAGYIILGYIPKQLQEKYLSTPLDWIIHTYGNNDIKNSWLSKNYEPCFDLLFKLLECQSDKFNNNNLSIQETIDFLLLKSYQHSLGHKYEQFLHYWVNKPNVELTCVYDAKDLFIKDFNSFPFERSKRGELVDFKRKGIGLALHTVAALWVQQDNMYVHASKTQTQEGILLWNNFEMVQHLEVLNDKPLLTNIQIEQQINDLRSHINTRKKLHALK